MTIFNLTKNDFETFTIVTNPVRTYTSSSTYGSTGSVSVFPRRSSIEKETAPLSAFIEATHDDSDIEALLRSIQSIGSIIRNSSTLEEERASLFGRMVTLYLEKVNEQSTSVRKHKKLDVIRFTPSYNFTSNTARKLVVKNILNKYYRDMYPSAHWAYSNYHSLNFFTGSSVPTSSVLLYPNVSGPASTAHEGYVTGTYALSGAFSFDFYINPRYQQDAFDGNFHAGTIFHLSSSYAVSLVSGSAKDENGRAVGFRLKLQLSHSADVSPSVASPGTYPSDLVFLSDDNSLSLNRWHHAVIRWGTSQVNAGTGSFNIDGTDMGTFVVPSGTIALREFGQPPLVLALGNYYEGYDDMKYFFAADPALRDGLVELDSTTSINEPSGYRFRHPLNAEVHDLALKRYYMTDVDIAGSASVGPKSIDANDVALYVPPFFIEDSPFRQFVGDVGGVMQTPFFEVDGTTNDPFNVAMSFGVAGHTINLENFVRDFASNVYPRLHHLTGVAVMNTTALRSANEFLYDQPFVVKRNMTLLPCDDGLFVPSYELLASESNRTKFVDDLGIEDLSFINLDDLVSTASLLFGTSFESETKSQDEANDFTDEAIGFTPEQPGRVPGAAYLGYVGRVNQEIASGTFDPGIQTGAPLTIYQRTRDASSNQVTFFDISNLFYGKRILPGSFTMTDPDLSGSTGRVSITLKDDGMGNLYRADCLTSQSKWNSVGNIYYSEGIVVVKSPHLFFFGQHEYEMSFRGEQNIHVLKLNALAPANMLNSSSNPNFVSVKPSAYPNDPDSEFVYVSGINFHDDNMNVVMKAQLAQPIMKRHGDRISFAVKMDF